MVIINLKHDVNYQGFCGEQQIAMKRYFSLRSYRNVEKGDKIYIRQDLADGISYGGYYFIDSMNNFKGKEVTITNVYNREIDKVFLLEDCRSFIWSFAMIDWVRTLGESTMNNNGCKAGLLNWLQGGVQ